MDNKELITALKTLADEKGISEDAIIGSLERALLAAYKRSNDAEQNVEVKIDADKGEIKVLQIRAVVPDDGPMDPISEIYLAEALKINKAYEVDDEVKFEITPSDFGRLAAQSAKQVIMQGVREAEREAVVDRFSDYQDEIITGRVDREDRNGIFVTFPDGQQALMRPQDQMPNEKYRINEQVKVLLTEINVDAKRGPQLNVSRTQPDFVKRLFEQEVPEVYDGTVEIMSISREAGDRSKISVRTNDGDLDPVGTLVGPRGSRVQAVVNELHGENMDIVEWVEDEAQYIANALNPSEVVDVIFDPKNERSVTVIVPDHQLSLAIGKRGQNARLAAKLTNFKIDIKSESEAADMDIPSAAPAAATAEVEEVEATETETTEAETTEAPADDVEYTDASLFLEEFGAEKSAETEDKEAE